MDNHFLRWIQCQLEKEQAKKQHRDIHIKCISRLNARVRSVAIKLDLEYFHFHCLRHTFVSTFIENDINPSVVKELVRHGDIKTTLDIYTHVKKESKREALDKVFGGNKER